MASLESLLNRFHQQDRAALAQAITIIESTAEGDMPKKRAILEKVLAPKNTIRVAISGPPGVGKSTFINAFGQQIVRFGFFLGVLPIDPSSEYSQGSILGDKTRMTELLGLENVFIRPSPSKGVLGGVSLNTPDTVKLIESFGCNFVVLETVGVGQSEAMARHLCDHFVLLLQPGLGDSVQLMKKGVLESADFILINKADEHKELAQKLLNSLKGFKNSQEVLVPISLVSSKTHQGIDIFFKNLLDKHENLKCSGALLKKRKFQQEELYYYCFEQELNRRIKNWPGLKHDLEQGLKRASAGIMPQIDLLVEKILKRM